MTQLQRPIWYEGMTLDPHHFQQWDRYFRSLVNSRVRSIAPFDWGLMAVDLDAEALANGKVVVRNCRGVTVDGLAFDIPRVDPPPEPRSVENHFPPSEEGAKVFLGIPNERPGGRNCSLDGGESKRPMRYVLEHIAVNDDNTGGDERHVGVGRPAFVLLFGDEPLDEYTTIQMAELTRASDGTMRASPQFIAPCLVIGASENLMRIAQRLLELLVAKANALSERRRQQPSGQIEYSSADVSTFWLLHTLHSVIPMLRYMLTSAKTHPEDLYALLMTIGGQLLTFSSESDYQLRDLPIYDHDNPTEAFVSLETMIRRLLETVISTNVVILPFEKRSEVVMLYRVPDEQLFRTAQFVLTTSGDKPERAVIDEVPRKIKIAAPETIDQLVISARPGLGLTHSSIPPIGLPTRPGLQYFRLEKTGVLWEGICRTGALAVFAPAEFKTLQIKLLAVKEQR